MLTTGQHQVELDGVTQAFEVAGEGPVVFVHSGGPGIDSEPMRMPLLEQQMTMVYLDPIGSGKSGLLPGGNYSITEYARRVELLRDHLGVTDGVLIGHSHGGFVTLQYGLDYPGRMRGLVVYDSAPTNSSDLWEEAMRQVASFAERWPDRPEAVAAVQGVQSTGVHDADSLREYLMGILPLYFADYRKTVDQLGAPLVLEVSTYDPNRKPSEWDVRGKLGAIDDPTLVLVGTYDWICPPVWARQIDAEMTNSRIVEFANSGHLLHLEEPAEFFKILRDFVLEVDQRQN